MSKHIFLKKFIKQFYNKGANKRRTQERSAHKIAYTANLCLSTFDKKIHFEDQEIFKAFEKCGYTLMNSEGEFTWERFHSNHTLVLTDKFLNINVQSNKDLRSSRINSYPPNWSKETKVRIDNLKTDLQEFWLQNNHLLEN
ncbi:hypothetical protein RQM65_06665 [Pricia sp. S334]|uniref:Uncharacterized protein n=1 Tax=Pricia mediterranea TaxID=3076079 RepID=A0ABU3L3M1_9FLAO|nr:hypothetical protein [Pricia sp. S334]MDT7828340.1 hypothetical protein [Pricia sp. S334]